MPIPEIFLIKRMEDLQTALVGRCNKGQFFITETLPSPNQTNVDLGSGRVYVMRYLFELNGEFIRADHEIADRPSGRELVELVEAKKHSFLRNLEPYELCDISVKPFEIILDGIRFGLVPNEENESIDLEPGPLITFMEPWDGEYYT